MIINVTGGPDLSLIEVSEASAIIQEAAHEDANIIFGAVVDPTMAGKVKITVIATGFDRPATRASRRRRRQPRRSICTHYTAWKQDGEQRLAAAGGGAGHELRASARARPAGGRTSDDALRNRCRPGRRIRAGVAAGRAGIPAPAERQ